MSLYIANNKSVYLVVVNPTILPSKKTKLTSPKTTIPLETHSLTFFFSNDKKLIITVLKSKLYFSNRPKTLKTSKKSPMISFQTPLNLTHHISTQSELSV